MISVRRDTPPRQSVRIQARETPRHHRGDRVVDRRSSPFADADLQQREGRQSMMIVKPWQ